MSGRTCGAWNENTPLGGGGGDAWTSALNTHARARAARRDHDHGRPRMTFTRKHAKPMVTLLLFVLVTVPGCAVWEAHHRALDEAQRLPPAAEMPRRDERWHESYVIEIGGGGRSPHLDALVRGAGVSVETFTLHMHKRLPLAQAA